MITIDNVNYYSEKDLRIMALPGEALGETTLKDWIKHGILREAPYETGEGNARRVWWSEADLRHLTTLLHRRKSLREHHCRCTPDLLCDIVIWKWFYFGDLQTDIDLTQARLALPTWIEARKKTSRERSKQGADQTLEDLFGPNPQRARVSRELLIRLEEGNEHLYTIDDRNNPGEYDEWAAFEPQDFGKALKQVRPNPKEPAAQIGPVRILLDELSHWLPATLKLFHGLSVQADELARQGGLRPVQDLSDWHWEKARELNLLLLARRYLGLLDDPPTKSITLGALLPTACSTLFLLLAWLKGAQENEPLSPIERVLLETVNPPVLCTIIHIPAKSAEGPLVLNIALSAPSPLDHS